MPLSLPNGKKLVVCISSDFDAHSVWMGTFGLSSPSYLSRGEFGAKVGVPRLLNLFERHKIAATWCTPGHTMETFPDEVQAIAAAGHELAAHGCFHEAVTKLEADQERHLMQRQLEQHEQALGNRPRGYRSPAWDFTEATLSILEEFEFEWDSSLMGRDFEPYHPQPVAVNWESGSVYGPESPLLEIPVSWYMDDFPPAEYVPGVSLGLSGTEAMFERWKDHFDYAYEHIPNGVVTLTLHPQTSGRAHQIRILERLIEHMASKDGIWFTTLSNVYDCWADEPSTSS